MIETMDQAHELGYQDGKAGNSPSFSGPLVHMHSYVAGYWEGFFEAGECDGAEEE